MFLEWVTARFGNSIGSFETDTATSQPYRFIVGSDSQASSKSGFEHRQIPSTKQMNISVTPNF